MKVLFRFLFFVLFCSFSFGQKNISLLPAPYSISSTEGTFTINKNTKIRNNAASSTLINLLSESFDIKTTVDKSEDNTIIFDKKKELENEAYEIDITNSSIKVYASTEVGHFYAIQTLLQLMDENKSFPLVKISDAPRFPHRGLMLDVSRHFMPKGFVKKLIDIMAMYKLNTLHWHLTDDQGWRIEIKQYPKLTEVGSVRKESMDGHYRDGKYDGKPHGGFYTQEDIKEIVAYAISKHVQIIPEIEMPGHAVAALTSYPSLGCSGGPYEVRTEWGVATDVFCPYEETFTFLENVLLEVMTLFPSKYIHIGGDECPKDSWKASDFCQKLILDKNLKDEHGLQSYFITRIDNFVSSKGKKIIGWDEILEGGLSPNATVMSWRGIAGGIEAAKQGHDVIMTPNSHLYLDYYQGNPDIEPLAIGGFLPLEKVYSYEPIPSELSQEEAKHILGIQGNLWTEYIQNPSQAEYMLFPRALAVAETAWSPKETKNYPDFVKRVQGQFYRLEEKGVNYSTALYSLKMELLKGENNNVKIGLISPIPTCEIRYTTDGTAPILSSSLYSNDAISIDRDNEIKAALFSKGMQMGGVFSQKIKVNKLTGMLYKQNFKSSKYTAGSKNGLTDGIKGSINKLDEWVGINGENLDLQFDLKDKKKSNQLIMSFLHAPSSWIMLPSEVQVFGSKDGQRFKLLKNVQIKREHNKEDRTEDVNISLGSKKYESLKIVAKNFGELPADHPGKGNPAWLFIDEIELK